MANISTPVLDEIAHRVPQHRTNTTACRAGVILSFGYKSSTLAAQETSLHFTFWLRDITNECNKADFGHEDCLGRITIHNGQ